MEQNHNLFRINTLLLKNIYFMYRCFEGWWIENNFGPFCLLRAFLSLQVCLRSSRAFRWWCQITQLTWLTRQPITSSIPRVTWLMRPIKFSTRRVTSSTRARFIFKRRTDTLSIHVSSRSTSSSRWRHRTEIFHTSKVIILKCLMKTVNSTIQIAFNIMFWNHQHNVLKSST